MTLCGCTWESFTELNRGFVGVHSDLVLGVLGGSGGAAHQAKRQHKLALGYSRNPCQHRHRTILQTGLTNEIEARTRHRDLI